MRFASSLAVCTVALIGSLALAGSARAGQVVNVDFQFNPSDPTANPSTTFVGQGAIASPGNVWNGLNAPVGNVLFNSQPSTGIFATTTSPFTLSGLVDSTGATDWA